VELDAREMSRRELFIRSGAAVAGLALLHAPWLARAFPSRTGEEVIPWLDQPPANPMPQVVANQLQWEQLDTWITPNERFFSVGHYNKPAIDPTGWRLEITGMVKHPLRFTLDEIKARPRQEVVFTLECSGNHGLP
jgi:DMSO/TMAO reductase YedYZ molybdopterin-dependent catalytic subunit